MGIAPERGTVPGYKLSRAPEVPRAQRRNRQAVTEILRVEVVVLLAQDELIRDIPDQGPRACSQVESSSSEAGDALTKLVHVVKNYMLPGISLCFREQGCYGAAVRLVGVVV